VPLPPFLTWDDDGEIHLTGHRIGLYTLARCLQEGMSVEEIAEEYPSLPLERVRQVLDFIEENRAEVEAYAAEYRADLEQQEAAPPGPGVLRIRRLAQALCEAETRFGADPEWGKLPLQEKLRRIEQGQGETQCIFDQLGRANGPDSHFPG
jgi:uncharacterized protein (DUF433 family)